MPNLKISLKLGEITEMLLTNQAVYKALRTIHDEFIFQNPNIGEMLVAKISARKAKQGENVWLTH